MDAIEFIGFLITMCAFVFLALQQMRRQVTQMGNEETPEYAEEFYSVEDEELLVVKKHFLQKKPKSQRMLTGSYALESAITERPSPSTSGSWTLGSSVEDRYDAPRQPLVSEKLRIEKCSERVVDRQPFLHGRLRDAVVWREILTSPRGIEPYDERW